MPKSYKILGQALPSPNTFTDLYTVPAGNNAVISTLNVCNTSTSAVTFRLMARKAGNTITRQQYLVFDSPLPALDALGITLGITLSSSDVLTGFSTAGNVVFTVFGTEIY
jgi:hypothetical protein